MTPETKDLARLLLAEVASAKNYSGLPTPTMLFLGAETLISGLASLIGPRMDAETAYRSEIVKYMEEGDSHAKAEAKAKASQPYADYKKLEMVYELCEAQILLVKKFNNMLEGEYKRS